MTIYTGPVFDMARTQFGLIADHLQIPTDERARLLYPKRAITVSIPVHMDDGRTEVFQGYRVQHHLTLGPTKGGTRFSSNLDIGEVAALAIWMSWKCALAGLPYGGAKGGVTCDPPSLSRRELEAVSRRYMQEMIPFVSPQTDVMAPDMGTNEQVMAWFMDTYSMYQGHAVAEIVTGKPVSLGGTEGRREATGRGVAYLVARACDMIGLKSQECTAVVQGFGNVGSVTAYTLARRHGVTITGVSDHTAALYDPAGLPLDAIEALAPGGGGNVTLRVRRQPRLVRIEIEDDGPGLATPDAPIFDAFFSTKVQGTGLGLSITHRIVTDHGGDITVDSKAGRTVFRISLPVDTE